MADLEKTSISRREKTMFISFLISSAGPIATGINAVTSRSATQIADFLRRTTELLALFVSWWVYRKIHRGMEFVHNTEIEFRHDVETELDHDGKTKFENDGCTEFEHNREIGSEHVDSVRMEHIANITVSGSMFCSGIVIFAIGVSRLFIYKISGNVITGLVIAVSGLLVNTWFWRRYSIMIREKFDPIISGQQRLYRAKVFVDVAVVIALASVTIAPDHYAIKYIDALGCIVVSFYLLYNGFDIVRICYALLKRVLKGRS